MRACTYDTTKAYIPIHNVSMYVCILLISFIVIERLPV